MYIQLSLRENDLKIFILSCAVLSCKVLLMAVFIGRTRLKKQIFISPEDALKKGKVCYDDPDIERLRRGDKVDSWGIVELQGDLESRVNGSLQSQFVGDLHYGMQSNGVPTLIIGHHILYGKMVPLEKPWAIMEKKKYDDKVEYVIKALVEKKLLFKIRPKPIIAAVPGI